MLQGWAVERMVERVATLDARINGPLPGDRRSHPAIGIKVIFTPYLVQRFRDLVPLYVSFIFHSESAQFSLQELTFVDNVLLITVFD